jgi:hypothetical protein
MWDLTIPGNNDHDFYIVTTVGTALVHNAVSPEGDECGLMDGDGGDDGSKSRGSTGRTTAGSLAEQRAMEYAKEYPEYGDVLDVNMKDERWPASDGWVKMEMDVDGVEVHYDYNLNTGETDDFKFKDRDN